MFCKIKFKLYDIYFSLSYALSLSLSDIFGLCNFSKFNTYICCLAVCCKIANYYVERTHKWKHTRGFDVCDMWCYSLQLFYKPNYCLYTNGVCVLYFFFRNLKWLEISMKLEIRYRCIKLYYGCWHDTMGQSKGNGTTTHSMCVS